MSKHEDEYGRIDFTKTGYPQVIRMVRDEFNAYQDKMLEVATNAYEDLQKIKGKKLFQRQIEHFDTILAYQLTGGSASARRHVMSKISLVDWNNIWDVKLSLFVLNERGYPKRLKKPLKKDFPKLNNRAKSFSLSCGEAVATFDEDSLSMSWEVEGNRSAEQAHESYMFKALCRAFGNYQWKRKEGGAFHYINEHMRDGAIDSRTALQSHMSYTFGPVGQQMKDDALGFPLR